MTTQISLSFAPVFAGINSVEELKAAANALTESLIAQVRADYTARAEEIVRSSKSAAETAPKAETAPEAPKAEVKPQPAPKKETKKATPKAETKKAETKKATAKKAEKSAPKAETKTKVEDVATVSISDTAAVSKLNFTLERYNDKCYVLRGDTKAIRADLRNQGVYNKFLKGGEGWIIRNENVEQLAKSLNLTLSQN